ncbi:MAG TPA: ATP-binding protein [Bacteroidales bacterium]|nr:ATP-binding protein [Bacteroidales bacterium]
MKQINNQNCSFNDFLKIIKEKSDGGKSLVGVSEILEQTSKENFGNKNIKQLFKLLDEGTVTTSVNRRDKDELYICYIGEKKYKNSFGNKDVFKKIIDYFLLYCTISKTPSINEFHLITEDKYVTHSFFDYTKKINADFTEIKILLNVVKGFLNGMHPMFMYDINLDSTELAYYSEKMMDMSNTLIKHDILSVHNEPDGVSCRIGITKRTLQLIQNNALNLQIKESKIHSGLYVYKPLETIPEIKLFYNSTTEKMFNNTCNIIKKSANNNDINFSLLLYGPSGTGKTEFAYQLARQTGSGIMQLDFSQIQSKWVGETEKNVRKVFNDYINLSKKSDMPLILLINEADGLMTKRISVNTSNDIYSNQTQAQLLEILEEFKGIMVATTNLYKNIDTAFHRRFLYRLKIDMPNYDTKEKLINYSMLTKYISQKAIKTVLKEKWSAAQLKNIERKIQQLEMIDDIDEKLILEIMHEEGFFDNSPKLGFFIEDK